MNDVKKKVYTKIESLADFEHGVLYEGGKETKNFLKYTVIIKVSDNKLRIYQGEKYLRTGTIEVTFITVDSSMLEAIKNI